MDTQKENEWLKGKVKILESKIETLNENRIHCRQCHSINIKLTLKETKEDKNTYIIECNDCSFKEERSIYHNTII